MAEFCPSRCNHVMYYFFSIYMTLFSKGSISSCYDHPYKYIATTPIKIKALYTAADRAGRPIVLSYVMPTMGKHKYTITVPEFRNHSSIVP